MTTQSRVPSWAGLVCAALTLGVLAQARAPVVVAANWRIDPARTHIAFAIDAVGYPHTNGQFLQFAGCISVDFEHPERSGVSFQVESQSVDGRSTITCARMLSSAPRVFRQSTLSRVRSQRLTTTRSGLSAWSGSPVCPSRGRQTFIAIHAAYRPNRRERC